MRSSSTATTYSCTETATPTNLSFQRKASREQRPTRQETFPTLAHLTFLALPELTVYRRVPTLAMLGAGNTAGVGARSTSVGEKRRREATRGRGWAWSALIAALCIWLMLAATWGASLLLWPIAAMLSVVAWFRSRRDALLWLGVAFNLFTLWYFVEKLRELEIAGSIGAVLNL
jgi:hypothetical protein